MTLATLQWLPSIGGVIVLVVGLAAAFGYSKTQVGKTWRESAEGWQAENEANKERADRLAAELAHTASELKTANLRTDITQVLEALQTQHQEATTLLTRIADEADGSATAAHTALKRIADESAQRNGHIAEVLAKNSVRLSEQHAETLGVLRTIAGESDQRNSEILKIAAETFKTVEMLRAASTKSAVKTVETLHLEAESESDQAV